MTTECMCDPEVWGPDGLVDGGTGHNPDCPNYPRDAASAAPTPAAPTTPRTEAGRRLITMLAQIDPEPQGIGWVNDAILAIEAEARSTPAEALDVRPESDLLRIPWPQASVTEGLDVAIEALEWIADRADRRPDGTYNYDRDALRQKARDALARLSERRDKEGTE